MESGKVKPDRKENWRENTNVLSQLTFCWTLPVFWEGFRKTLTADDLTKPLKEHSSSYLGEKFQKKWEEQLLRAKKTGKKPSLTSVIIKVFGFHVALLGLVVFVYEVILRVSQPLFLGGLIRYFSQVGEAEQTVSKQEAYLYAGGLIGCSALSTIMIHPNHTSLMHTGMKIRVAVCSLVYRHTMKLNKSALGQSTGQIINLLSNDVNRFDFALLMIHMLWIGPTQTLLVTYLMWNIMGASAFVGMAALLAFIPLIAWLGKKISSYRLKTALRTDERVRLMNEIITGIQVIKMYTWEKPFAALVDVARRKEIKEIRRSMQIKGFNLSFVIFHARAAIFITILSYILLGNTINAEKVFVLTSLYNAVRQTMTIFFPSAITMLAEGMVSVKRIQAFLMINAQSDTNNASLPANGKLGLYQSNNVTHTSSHCQNSSENIHKPGIFINRATAKWAENSHDNTLSNITLQVRPGCLTTVIGPVGSGKTSLLHAILKELHLSSGSIEIGGTISYASQEPWLFHGSVRQNILFGQDFDAKKYKEVVRVCCLKTDYEQFPYGDRTIVGERGVSLSGGQRARINLARAVYKDADIYLLDDPLSAVDTHVGKHLFTDCVQGYLKDKAVILITHQLQHLETVPQIVYLENGSIKAIGSYEAVKNSGHEFLFKFADQEEEKGEEVKIDTQTPKLEGFRSRQQSIRSTSSFLVDESLLPVPLENTEVQKEGVIGWKVYAAYLTSGPGICYAASVFLMFAITQLLASCGDYWITYWVNLEEYFTKMGKHTSNSTISNITNSLIQNNTYVDPASTPFLFIIPREVCVYVFSVLTLGTIFFALLRAYMFFNMCMKSSIVLHNNMFKSITQATMRFFNTTSSGTVLNRFSKDMGAIDELLPQSMMDVFQISITCVAIVLVVLTINPLLTIPTIAAVLIFYFFRKFYIATARSVKRVESIARSPVFAHINASVQGLTTIKAFKAENILIQEFDNHQDLHSSAWFLFICSNRAFGFWLDIVCLLYQAIVTLSFLVLGGENLGGNVGLAISQTIGLTGMFQWGMRQSAELENQMTSVERVLEYFNLESEPPLESPPGKGPRKTWPENGKIEFCGVFLRYSEADPCVLKDLNFTFQPKEKVGIVGRTGAGKSSLIQALFRLAEIEGSIIIDGLDTGNMGLHELRGKISIIPQEPVLFSATIRKNLDPFDEHRDDVLWSALQQVELKEVVRDMLGGLQAQISEGGSNLSVGQRQLVCLARAIVKNNKILVLDEATANVDPQTDTFIQETIRKKFSECTVLTIAHRLNTIMDSDKVLVMDAGTVVEFDHPHVLLQDPDGIFTSMVQQTGHSTEEVLRKIAYENYEKRKESGDTLSLKKL